MSVQCGGINGREHEIAPLVYVGQSEMDVVRPADGRKVISKKYQCSHVGCGVVFETPSSPQVLEKNGLMAIATPHDALIHGMP